MGQAGYPLQGYVFVEIRDSKQKPYSFKLNIEHREPVDIGLEVQLKPCKVWDNVFGHSTFKRPQLIHSKVSIINSPFLSGFRIE